MWTLLNLVATVTLSLPVVTTAISQPAISEDPIVALVEAPVDVTVSSSDAHAMINDINRVRAASGLPPVVEDPQLSRVAQLRADDMMAGRYVGHVSPSGQTPYTAMSSLGITYSWAGENLALDDNERSAFSAFMHSPDHRDNMLERNFHHVGIAAIRTSNLGELFVQEFTN